MSDPRSLWLVTLNGVPQALAWGFVKTRAEVAEENYKARDAALDDNQATADGWDATVTQWKRVPKTMNTFEELTATLVGRELTVAGLTYDLDTAGRAKTVGEAHAPDATVVDEAALLAAVETLGRELQFVEKDTLKNWRASHATDAALKGEDSLVHRQDGTKTRTNKA